MYTNIIFILYGIAILISLVCLVFIGLIFVKKNDRTNRAYITVRAFAITVLLTDLLYFLFYYREIVQEKYELLLPYRIIDYTLCTLVFILWLKIMGNILSSVSHRKIITVGVYINIIRVAVSIIVTSFFMGEYYNIDDPTVCKIWTAAEFIFILLTALVMSCATIYILTESESSLKKKYTAAVSSLLLIWSVIQGVVDMGLFIGKYGISAWTLETPDFTGAILFLVNLATCIFVFKEDFSPLFFPQEAADPSTDTSLSDKLDAIAASHKLTVREREVMALIYEGCTNPDIGEKLFISINTVKKHTHNVFEKLDVSNRMEVVHLINSWNNNQ